MPRNVINRSISFDPVLFHKMEDRRNKLLMDRSEYIKRLILKDMLSGGKDMEILSVPDEIVTQATSHNSRVDPNPEARQDRKTRKKKP